MQTNRFDTLDLLVTTDFFSKLYDALKTQNRRDCCNGICFVMASGNSHSDFAHNLPATRLYLGVLRLQVSATTGAATGGATGGVLGLLAGIGALAIPGLGPFIAAGPIHRGA
jgi:hypothetical protein